MKGTELDYIDSITRWEEKRKLFLWKVNGVEIWEYIRLAVLPIILRMLTEQKGKFLLEYIAENKTNRVGDRLKEIPRRVLKQRDVLIVNSPERVNIDGKLVSRYIDKMFENLDYDYYILERRYAENKEDLIFSQNVILYDHGSLACEWKKNKGIEKKCEDLIWLIEKDFHIKLEQKDKKYIINVVYSVLQNRKVYKNFYKILLLQIRPKVIVILKAVQQYNKYLIEAAKEMGIITIEYEHSLVMAESFENYYQKHRELKTYPDYKWLWGDSVKGSYRLPIEADAIRVIGNGYHDWRIRQACQMFKKNSNKKTILIISDFFKTGLEELALELAQKLSREKYDVIFKLHPGERNWKCKYRELVDTDVKVRGNEPNNDIYKYLVTADYIVGSASTALSEAVELDTPIYIYSKSRMAIYSQYIIDAGAACKIDSADDFIVKIEKGNYEKGESLYKTEPIENMNREIERIIRG